MKQILKLIALIIVIVTLPLFLFFLFGEDDTPYEENNATFYIKNIYLLEDENISLLSIKTHDKEFQKINENDDDFSLKQDIFWVKLVLNPLDSKKKYILTTEHYEVMESSFTHKQQANSFNIMENFYITFFPQESSIYYLKLQNHDYHNYLSISIIEESFLPMIMEFSSYFIFFIGLIFGLIIMVAIYNLALFYYNRQYAFLFYAFMQFGMGTLLLVDAHLFFSINDINSNFIILFSMIFALLFSRSFLETKKYLPSIDKLLRFIILLTLIDMFFSLGYIIEYKLLTFVSLLILILGFLRIKQSYTPANFFVIGWFFMTFSIYTLEYEKTNVTANFLYLGSPIEAIMLALALSLQMKQLKEEKEKQTELMYHQSRLASLGDMLGNIAHQWRQPLNRLAYICMNVEKLDEREKRSKKLDEASQQLEFMSQTIEDFKNFYAPSKRKELFSIAKEVKNIVNFIEYQNIEIKLEIEEDSQIINYKNEFKQVLLNLLSNAKEVLIERKIDKPKISILIEKNIISIQDNAGGIDLKNIEKIFEPYFSTKKQGMGIGLYMSKMIIENNMDGKLTVKNLAKGVEFRITL